MTVTIPLPWPSPPLKSNDRRHHMAQAKAFKQAKAEAQYAIRIAKVQPIVGAVVTLHWRVPDRRRRDADGAFPTLKACLDALTAEHVNGVPILPDDNWVHVIASGCRIHPPDGPPAMWLTLDDVHPYDPPEGQA